MERKSRNRDGIYLLLRVGGEIDEQ
jgi:hypothetical protein